MSWKITVDADTCIGSGMCAGVRPELFRLDAGYAEVLADRVEPDEALLDVADSCPVEAIVVRDGSGVEVGPRG